MYRLSLINRSSVLIGAPIIIIMLRGAPIINNLNRCFLSCLAKTPMKLFFKL